MQAQERQAAVVDSQAFPDAITQDEAAVEHRDLGLGTRVELAVDAYLDGGVARVVDVIVGALGHARIRRSGSAAAAPFY